MHRRVSFFAALLFVCTTTVAPAQVGHAFQISHLRCKAMTCSVGEGYQPGLSTVEAAGNLPAYAGYDVRLVLYRKSGPHMSLIDTRSLGIFSDGHFTASIPAYNLPDGLYVFGLMPKNTTDVLAAGTFVKGTPAESAAASQRVAATSGITGEWIGIAGTYGDVHIYGDGSYTFNQLRGSYRQSGRNITFAGPLAVWNGGHATLGNGVIEFYWTTAQGAKQYFVFEKR